MIGVHLTIEWDGPFHFFWKTVVWANSLNKLDHHIIWSYSVTLNMCSLKEENVDC